MALFNEADVRARAQQDVTRNFSKTASEIITEASLEAFNDLSYKTYDVFLSHSIKDAELILGVKGLIEDLGYDVYIDWIDDPQLNRNEVSKDTANKLRDRMKNSKSLFYVTTENSDNSKWMPWECGYFDGIKEKVAIIPIKKSSFNNEYNGQEYLGLYPYVVKENSNNGKEMLWVHLSNSKYTSYENWIKTSNGKIQWKEV
ncbi:hypothetical protein BPUTSESOX_345 [uncultured Gammaproteobacteria bacterium]|jgi:hypothetical protein|nr:hypothetical protein [uncultured Gammaproteobacteria bacterium]CAC9659158.1 hypothetical protein [uncultured Gammaproteobacteria bacterium]VVH50361.1 hypothetical protein BPUTSESOX_345 [uncultured Gammaproteobacteria bacterium]